MRRLLRILSYKHGALVEPGQGAAADLGTATAEGNPRVAPEPASHTTQEASMSNRTAADSNGGTGADCAGTAREWLTSEERAEVLERRFDKQSYHPKAFPGTCWALRYTVDGSTAAQTKLVEHGAVRYVLDGLNCLRDRLLDACADADADAEAEAEADGNAATPHQQTLIDEATTAWDALLELVVRLRDDTEASGVVGVARITEWTCKSYACCETATDVECASDESRSGNAKCAEPQAPDAPVPGMDCARLWVYWLKAGAASAYHVTVMCSLLRSWLERNGSDALADRIGALGACDLVVKEVLARHGLAEPGVAEIGCAAICAIAGQNDCNQARLLNANACEAVVRYALVPHAETSKMVAEEATRAVCNLAVANEANRSRLTEVGAVEAVLHEVVEVFGATDALLAEFGCIAMLNLALRTESQTLLGTEGACRSIVEHILKPHIRNPRICELACWVVCNLADRNAENQRMLAENGVCELIVNRLLRPFGRCHDDLARQACGAISHMVVDNEETMHRFEAIGACKCVIQCCLIPHGPTRPEAAKSACIAIAHLTLTQACTAQCLESGGCKAIVDCALRPHTATRPEVATEAMVAIAQLATDSADAREFFGSGGACDAIADVLRMHGPEDMGVAKYACLAVCNLCVLPANAARFADAGVCELIVTHALVPHGASSVPSAIEYAAAIAQLASFTVEIRSRLNNVNAGLCLVHHAIQPHLLTDTDPDAHGTDATASATATTATKLKPTKASAISSKLETALPVPSPLRDLAEFALRAVCNLAVRVDQLNGKREALAAVLGMLERFGARDVTVAANACRALTNLAAGQEMVDICEASNVSTVLVHCALLPHGKDSAVVAAQACGAICQLTVHSLQLRDRLGALGACQYVVSHALEPHGRAHAGVAEQSCCAINNLADRSSTNLVRLADAGACEAIVRCALIPHGEKHDAVAVRFACLAMGNLCVHKANVQRFEALEASRLIVDLVLGDSNTNEPKVALEACATISQIAATGASARKMLRDAGAVHAVVRRALERHGRADAGVAEFAVSALGNLAVNVDNHNDLADSGACEALARCALQAHAAENPLVAEQVCRAIANLGASAANDRRMGKAGVCRDLVDKIMKVYCAENAHIAELACKACFQLATRSADNRQRFLDAGVCEVIVFTVLPTWTSQPEVALQACSVLSAMCLVGLNTCRVVREMGAAQAIIEHVLKQHGKDASQWRLVMTACSALTDMCVDDTGADQLGELGMCELVVKNVLIPHAASHAGAAEAGARIVCNLAYAQSTNQWRLYDAGVCECLTRYVMNIHCSTDVRCAVEACRAVCNLAVNGPRGQRLLLNCGGCDAIVHHALLPHGSSSREVALNACWALHNLADTDHLIRQRLGEIGVCEALVHCVLVPHALDSEVIQHACQVLVCLVQDLLCHQLLREAGAARLIRQNIAGNHEDNDTKLWIDVALEDL